MKHFIYLSLFFALGLLLACQQNSNSPQELASNATPQLGKVNLQVSGSSEALPHFEQGLLYLHSFEYVDARDAFKKAQELDPEFGMAYWGELMSYNHSFWHRQFYNLAQETLLRMGSSSSERQKKFKTPLEKDLYKSVEILYGKGSKADRDVLYTNYLNKLYGKYPGNHEVATFYAVSVLATATSNKSDEHYDKCAAILQKVLRENPLHPGALHYFIHSRDYPSKAHLAIAEAEKYSKVAPDAAHALHMPSHIYIALGKWNEVINANIDSWNAGKVKHDENPNRPPSYHALSWLQYGLLQTGETELALRLLHDMERYATESPTIEARGYLVAMKGAHMVETDTWDGDIPKIRVNVEDLNVAIKTGFFYLEGMKGYHRQHIPYLESIIKKVKTDKYTASLNVGKDNIVMCSAGGFGNKPPDQKDIDMVSIMEKQLEAALAKLQGNDQQYLTLLKEATEIEEKMDKVFGPPVVLKPIHEEYAEALAKKQTYEQALIAFDKALAKHPRRIKSLKGKLAVAKQLKKSALIAELEKDIAACLGIEERKEVL